MDNGIKGIDKKGLRNFGLTIGGMIAVFFGILIPWLWGFELPFWPWVVSSIFLILAITVPETLRPVFIVWMKLGHVLGWINTRLLLSLVFYLMITPIGILLKLLGKDTLKRKYDLSEPSYRTVSKQPTAKNLEKPF